MTAESNFSDDDIIRMALQVIEHRFSLKRESLNNPEQVQNYLRLSLPALEHEVFCAVFLDSQNRVIAFETLFRSTISQTSVYPREVVKRALHHNAAAVIFAHNHPSGNDQPSPADINITTTLKNALALIDTRVLDHFIVAGSNIMSFAKRGLI